jgi:hypothetical protein
MKTEEEKELKTLKDLDIMKGKVHALGGEVGVDELRAEAIKWVKELNWKYCQDGRALFMEFFNLTEEELK